MHENKRAGVADNGSIESGPDQSWMSDSRNGWESAAELEYSPGRSRKKNASHIRSAAASKGGSPEVEAKVDAWWRMGSGSGLTRTGGGSDFA